MAKKEILDYIKAEMFPDFSITEHYITITNKLHFCMFQIFKIIDRIKLLYKINNKNNKTSLRNYYTLL